MYGISPPQGYSHPHSGHFLPSSIPSTSTPLQTLSNAAIAHANGPRPILPANEGVGNGIGTSQGMRSMSPNSGGKDAEPNEGGKGKKKAKETRKRGRKRLEEGIDAAAANDDLDADAKRKLQNRAAQRAFRERKERHVIDLEEKVVHQDAELAQCRELIEQLREENEALRRGENPPSSITADNPYFQSKPLQTASATITELPSTSPPDVKPLLQSRLSSGSGASPSFHHILNEPNSAPSFTQFETSTDATPSNPPSSYHIPPPSSVPPPASASSLTATPQNPIDIDMNQIDSFDFDAPFDFSESMALPPLFASLLDDISVPPSSSNNPDETNGISSTAQTAPQPDSLDCGCGDGEEPGSVPQTRRGSKQDSSTRDKSDEGMNEEDDSDSIVPRNFRIPCDKPECDFTAVSCALPIPWRPPNAPLGSVDKDLWIAQKCWAKLVSHPLFNECDSDELCQELRDKTRCSDDGRLVCHKEDVCEIFRLIPVKARLKSIQNQM